MTRGNFNLLAFDIETIPDAAGLRQLQSAPAELSDAEVVDMAQQNLRQDKSSDFFALHLHRIVVISCVLRLASGEIKIFSLPHEGGDDEAQALAEFFGGIKKYQPQLISWNGGGFDLPVIAQRALQRKIVAPTFWESDGDYKWNNYTNRYHERHLDLMDVLAFYQPRGWTPLDDVAQLCGLPGKIGIGGAGVWEAYQQGRLDEIRRYCEVDALITYLLGARFQHIRGMGDGDAEWRFVREHLQQQSGDRWSEFLDKWRPA